MFNRLTNTEGKRILVTNFSFLSVLTIFNLLVPFLTYPYLIRVLGANTYGLVIFAQAAIACLVVIIDFGFNVSATREVSIHRENKEALSSIVSGVFIIKGMLLILSFFVLTVVIYVIPKAYENRWILYLNMYACVYNFIFPVWFFRGIEKMKYIAYTTLISRMIFLVFIFLLVTNKEDYLLVPMLNGVGAIIAGLISIWIVFCHEKVTFKWVNTNKLITTFKGSSHFFYSRAAAVFSGKTTIMFIGSFFGLTEVAFYDFALKLSAVCKSPLSVLNTTIYPRMAKTKNMVFIKKIIPITFVFALIAYLMIAIFGEQIILILGGEEMLPAYWITVIVCLTIPLTSISYNLGCVLVVMGNSKAFNTSVIYQMIVLLTMIGILWLSNNVTLLNIGYSAVLTSLLGVSYRLYYSWPFLHKVDLA